ncbi:E3 ubiquitin-protein ligase RNF114-like [Corticium candelabrum]|uniref:E3 ubiquitin-protein ligase RNF114-like n=1 Tax=Corticium candelabrum TaxID=121492 RepID=UPI002E265EA6|nr:E3 ubiquitin-protein ligase RNF114-like [Corticium candelabrum]
MTFNCPYCEKRRLDCGGLLAHLNEKHATERTAAVCPVCAAMPWGNAHQKSSNLIKHFNLRHKFEYDTYVEFERDEGESLRAAIAKSLEDQ